MLGMAYIGSDSALHRLSAGVKLMGLMFICTGVFIVNSGIVLAAVALFSGTLYCLAKVTVHQLVRLFKSMIFPALLLFMAQIFFNDLSSAMYTVTRFMVILSLAMLMTVTTTTSQLIDTINHGLRVIVSREKANKVSLAISLAIRYIPKIREIFTEVKEAQQVRGLKNSWHSLAMITIIRVLKSADEMSDAITARSAGTHL
ncbi:energy-coupling factor transporter transmembrane protein EcfT (plasmid) [Vibrio sp. SS-MA-C1-2]|uniref:energy-coupling factor transporter transmembrane component T family protein n=1 Tax=Vibrio sp. SS-MA-C1-2 TaxID=2908646 RepID=UPI001F337B49|nr:energy-coupling factor transporter transmembrane protein EcfT [Vibrio sp. SS-MA-C1-2]UJF20303.1 energy-coupling factor transporter transmembrane protein EcfT [Vibrio sp. SS-MA-C1-2]